MTHYLGITSHIHIYNLTCLYFAVRPTHGSQRINRDSALLCIPCVLVAGSYISYRRCSEVLIHSK